MLDRRFLIILLFLNLCVFKVFSNPLFNEAHHIIEAADEKLKAFEIEYNKVIKYYTESLDDYKDLLIEENNYEQALIENQIMEKEISLTHEAFQTFLDHACTAMSTALRCDKQNLGYARAREMLINSYIIHMQYMIFPQGWFYGGWFYGIEPSQIPRSHEEIEEKKRDKIIEEEKSNLKIENNKNTSKFISFFKKLFRKIGVIF